MKKIRFGVVGCGGRGEGLYRVALKFRKDLEYVATCDPYEDRAEFLAKEIEEDGHQKPHVYVSHKEMLDNEKLDAILVATGWKEHIPVTLCAMEHGVAVCCEVGGAYSLEDLWDLVNTYNRTKTPVMMLENCCYGRLELMALNMHRKGLFGELVHCECGYRHDLRDEICDGEQNRSYRKRQYELWNCDNYPTHGIGPIAKILNINCGNKFLTISSIGSKSVGMHDFAVNQRADNKALQDVKFNQSDVVTSIIKCANGETITVTLDTALPRYYSRDFFVQGTKGMLDERGNAVFLEKDGPHPKYPHLPGYINNMDKYYEKYDHPLWKNFDPTGLGHGGMDAQVFEAFFSALHENRPMPIDVYDYAAWASISVLSEQSLAMGGMPVAFPDFTRGEWTTRKNTFLTEYDEVE